MYFRLIIIHIHTRTHTMGMFMCLCQHCLRDRQDCSPSLRRPAPVTHIKQKRPNDWQQLVSERQRSWTASVWVLMADFFFFFFSKCSLFIGCRLFWLFNTLIYKCLGYFLFVYSTTISVSFTPCTYTISGSQREPRPWLLQVWLTCQVGFHHQRWASSHLSCSSSSALLSLPFVPSVAGEKTLCRKYICIYIYYISVKPNPRADCLRCWMSSIEKNLL